MELSEFEISYKPRAAIKALALADFVAECTEPNDKATEDELINKENPNGNWLIMVDGSC